VRLRIALHMPNGTILYRLFDGAKALIDERNVLQIFYNQQLIAEFPSESYHSWQYVATPPQPTSRAGQLLQPQGA
jgi:hypothetical protein